MFCTSSGNHFSWIEMTLWKVQDVLIVSCNTHFMYTALHIRKAHLTILAPVKHLFLLTAACDTPPWTYMLVIF